MATKPNLSADEVRALAVQRRVAPHPRYHADQHGLRFLDVVTALTHCFRVAPDERQDDEGRLRHPDGYLVWCHFLRGRVVRVDIERHERADGRWLLVVTAFEVSR